MQEPGTTPNARELADRAAILEILALHCRGVDRADETALKACYWPDATTAYGNAPVPAWSFCEELVVGIKAFAQTHHAVSNALFDFGNGTANVESTLIAFHYLASDGGPDTEMTYFGRYLDQFEKRAEVWKIAHREPVMSWSQNSEASHDAAHPALSQLRKAARYPDDLIYR